MTRPLLGRILEESLDTEYAEAAARRAAAGDTGDGPRRPGRTAALVTAALGLLVAVALLETSASAGTRQSSRSAIIAGIEERRADLTDQQATLDELLRSNAALEVRLERLFADEQQTAGRARRLQARTGFLPVTGPGVRMVIDNGPAGDDARLVRADDLALVVAGLWSAGAEAVAIDGERVTALSPLSGSGQAVRLNNRSLTAPYTVLAVGDRRSLQSRFAESTHGLAWLELVQVVGFGWEVQDVSELALPAARLRPLRSAATIDAVREGEGAS